VRHLICLCIMGSLIFLIICLLKNIEPAGTGADDDDNGDVHFLSLYKDWPGNIFHEQDGINGEEED
jgi:hypothetical protein